jgi:hypothetical protein
MKADDKRKILNQTKVDFYNEIRTYQNTLKPQKEIEGVGSSSIVGEKNYPFLKIHNVSTQDKNNSFFKSGEVVKKEYKDIFKIKAKNILGSTQDTNIRNINDRLKNEISNIYKSKKEIEFTSEFEKELKFNKVVLNKVSGIVGSKNPLLTLSANENSKTSKQIEKYTQTDIKAKEAIITLYERGVNEHQIINLLALGEFGININKKLVPTKWSITAYDQTIEKHLHKKIINYPSIENFEIYYYKNKSDTHIMILLPDTYMGEHFEDWHNDSDSVSEPQVGVDYVGFDNRLRTSEPNNAGGYYATKIAINEYLNSRKKQASFIAIRIIRNYDVPLGVVFVRECVRECLKNQVLKTSTLKDVELFLKDYPTHFKHFINSKVLKERRAQTKLKDFW